MSLYVLQRLSSTCRQCIVHETRAHAERTSERLRQASHSQSFKSLHSPRMISLLMYVSHLRESEDTHESLLRQVSRAWPCYLAHLIVVAS